LPLEAYDDKELDKRAPIDWMVVKKNPPPGQKKDLTKPVTYTKTEIPAQGLWRDRDGLCYWRKLKVLKYLYQSERY
jgi:hypothetical protein